MAEDEDDEEEVIDYGAVADTPPIHLRQTVAVSMSSDGMTMLERNYRWHASVCDAASSGGSRVSDEDVDKLGRIFYEVWYQDLRMAARGDEWGFTGSGNCNFQVVHNSELVIQTPDGFWDIDLAKQEGTFNPQAVTERYPARPDELDDPRFNYEGITGEPGGISSVLGLPCRLMTIRNPGPPGTPGTTMTSCTWTEGAQWGLDSGGPGATGMGTDGYSEGFVLQSDTRWDEAANERLSFPLTTDSITVGTPFDQSVFSVPAGIKLVPSYTGEDDESTVEQDDSDEDE